MPDDLDVRIPRQHKDILFYSMTNMFKDKVLLFYGLQLPKVVDVIQTRSPVILVKDQDMDTSLKLEDGTIAHFEFESSPPTVNDQIRYGHYDLAIYKEHRCKIHRIIIYSARVNEVPKPLDIGSLQLVQTVIILKEDYDGDRIFEEIKRKLLCGEELDSQDEMSIILLPMMKSITEPSQRVLEVAELVREYMDEKSSLFLIGLLMAANYSNLDEKSKKTLLEVLVMARPFEDFYRKWREEGKEEGIEEGKKEGKKEGIEEGKKEGMEKGKKEGMEKAVTMLLKSGMPIYEVAERLDMKISKVIAMTEKESIET